MSEHYNTLRSNGFTFALLRLPDTVFRVVNLEMPDITISPAQSAYPTGSQYFPGGATEYGELTLRFIIDEDLKNYTELFNWITQQTFATNYAPKDKEQFLVSDGALTTLNNASVANKTFFFHDLFPISLSGWQFETNVSEPAPVECTATFKFSYFELK